MNARELRDVLVVLEDDQLDAPVKVLSLGGDCIIQDVVEVEVEDHTPEIDSTGVGRCTLWIRTEDES
jgi:hypothetical protein